ncbi:MAG: hypothetical protein MUF18_04955 [Fimbriiglobus sp.]|jgi:hypothetical protein|nr:hypothetical protein [Fimbriiglobus sp.]
MRQKLLGGLAAGFALLAVIGCDPPDGKVEGQTSAPPPQNSNADKNQPPRPGMNNAPKASGAPVGPPKRGGS